MAAMKTERDRKKKNFVKKIAMYARLHHGLARYMRTFCAILFDSELLGLYTRETRDTTHILWFPLFMLGGNYAG